MKEFPFVKNSVLVNIVIHKNSHVKASKNKSPFQIHSAMEPNRYLILNFCPDLAASKSSWKELNVVLLHSEYLFYMKP